MIEIVFNGSACASLKMSRDSKENEYNKASIGSPDDVFPFHLILSIKDICDHNFASMRQKTIDTQWSIYPKDEGDTVLDIKTELIKSRTRIFERVSQGEDIRIWYSDAPDELCGLHWFMSELQPFETKVGTVYIVKRPEYEYCDHNIIKRSSWGEISPGEWQKYTTFAETTSSALRKAYAMKWERLKQENAPLRAMLNGKLCSVPETIYDHFISKEIEVEADEFQEVMIVGRVLGNNDLGISDAWIAQRIDKMINDGLLSVVSNAPKDMPSYHRRLRKNHD